VSIYPILRSIYERLGEHERRLAGSQWVGKVKEVDAKKHVVRIVLGKDDDGAEVLSPWLPVAQVAGALKIHTLPSVGQVMAVRSEAGDVEQGVVEPYHWTDENQSPSQSGDEHVLTLGSVHMKLTGDVLTVTVGGMTMKISGGGVDFQGPQITHNGKHIDATHKHTDVEPGGALSGPPA
jgi:phage baseplate assembly protein gpV